MRKKRLFAFSLMIVLSALFITPQINPARIASAQDAKVKQDGFITGCSETVIDALDECIQERFSKVETIFGITRVGTTATKGHKQSFQAETEMERIVIASLELSGLQVYAYTKSAKPNNIKKP